MGHQKGYKNAAKNHISGRTTCGCCKTTSKLQGEGVGRCLAKRGGTLLVGARKSYMGRPFLDLAMVKWRLFLSPIPAHFTLQSHGCPFQTFHIPIPCDYDANTQERKYTKLRKVPYTYIHNIKYPQRSVLLNVSIQHSPLLIQLERKPPWMLSKLIPPSILLVMFLPRMMVGYGCSQVHIGGFVLYLASSSYFYQPNEVLPRMTMGYVFKWGVCPLPLPLIRRLHTSLNLNVSQLPFYYELPS